MPLVMTGGTGEERARETQAGVSTGLPSRSSNLKAIIDPFGAGPLGARDFNLGVTGPQTGASIQLLRSEGQYCVRPLIGCRIQWSCSCLHVNGSVGTKSQPAQPRYISAFQFKVCDLGIRAVQIDCPNPVWCAATAGTGCRIDGAI